MGARLLKKKVYKIIYNKLIMMENKMTKEDYEIYRVIWGGGIFYEKGEKEKR